MIRYPFLQKGTTIRVTAPSSGVEEPLHDMVKQAIGRLKEKGYLVVCGETVWTQKKAKSASATIRAAELNGFLQDEEIGLIFPPWGGELLIEIVNQIEYDHIQPKWIMGYSDTSVLLLAVTLSTGIATAHGANLIDARGNMRTRQQRCGKQYWRHGPANPFSNFHRNYFKKHGITNILHPVFFI